MDKQLRSRLSLLNPVHFLALGFGSGLAPFMPGTFGTVAAIPVFLLLCSLSITWYLLATVAVCVVGIWLCEKTANDMQTHDHPAIVWDEVAGFLITMIAVPVNWTTVVAGFVLFRVFDILKPWPISVLDQRVSGGLGIMVDDIVAGAFALLSMHGLLFFNLL